MVIKLLKLYLTKKIIDSARYMKSSLPNRVDNPIYHFASIYKVDPYAKLYQILLICQERQLLSRGRHRKIGKYRK